MTMKFEYLAFVKRKTFRLGKEIYIFELVSAAYVSLTRSLP